MTQAVDYAAPAVAGLREAMEQQERVAFSFFPVPHVATQDTYPPLIHEMT